MRRMAAPSVPDDVIEFVCGWTPVHDEARDVVNTLFGRGYNLGLVPIPEGADAAGILMIGGETHMELRGTQLDRDVGRLRWEIRDVLCGMWCAAMFKDVEVSLR